MQKNNTNIEEFLKNSFKEYKLPPSKNVWKNINSTLSAQNRFFTKKKAFYFLSAIVVIALFSILIINNNSKLSSSIINQNYALLQNSQKRNITANIEKQNKNIIQQIPKNTSEKIINTTNTENQNSNNNNFDTVKIIFNESNTGNINIEQETTQNNISQNNISIKNIELSDDNGCCPLKVEFTCSNYEFDNILWNFGDGNTSAKENPVYIYKEPGTYIISMEVFKNDISQIISHTIIVHPKPIADFDYKKEDASNSNLITFVNKSTNSQTYKWFFGDGSSSVEQIAKHNYENAGKYKLNLIAKSENNCLDTASQDIIIKESKYKIVFPTAFNPDINGSSGGYYSKTKKTNSVFFPIINNPVQEYALSIYSKKGTLLFKSIDINIGWDGYYRDALVPVGVYIYEVKGKFTQGTKFHQRGDVTVLYNTQR